MLCVDWLAWASIAVPAWVRTWVRVKFVISAAMSVSRMRDSDAVVFSIVVFRLLIVCSKRFCFAPRSARADDTRVIAESMAVMAADAPLAWVKVGVSAASVWIDEPAAGTSGAVNLTPVAVAANGVPVVPRAALTAALSWVMFWAL